MGFVPVTSTGVCLSACAHSARVLGPPCRAAVQSTAKKVWARRRAAAQHAWPLRICCCRREAMLERQCQLSASELLTAREQTLQENEKSFCLLGPGLCVGLPRGCRIACEIQSSATLHSRFVFTITAYCKNVAGKAPSPTQALVTPTR